MLRKPGIYKIDTTKLNGQKKGKNKIKKTNKASKNVWELHFYFPD